MSASPLPKRRTIVSSSAASAAPPPSKALDDVLEKIDASCTRVHQRAKSGIHKDTPSGGFRPDKIKATKAAFQAMSEEDLLASKCDDETPLPMPRPSGPPPNDK